MRSKLFFILSSLALLAACSKSNKCPYTTTRAVATASDVANLKVWLDTNSITYTQHTSGIFYHINAQGSGPVPAVCSDVTVKYIGRLTNGTGFDSSFLRYPDGMSFTLGEVIPGWQIGVPIIQKGGSITLYIPPSLAYGNVAYGPIPANSNLVFNIELVNVQ